MAHPVKVGDVKTMIGAALAEVPAYRIGENWAVIDDHDFANRFCIIHRATGLAITRNVHISRAKALAAVLEILLPQKTKEEMEPVYNSLGKPLQNVICGY